MATMDDYILLLIALEKFFAVKISYEIHDNELLAIIDVFEKWRHLLTWTQHTTMVYMDHKNLKYFMSAQVLNQRQARWNICHCPHFDFVIIYCPCTFRGSLMPSHDDLI
jgi:hypothetical protein